MQIQSVLVAVGTLAATGVSATPNHLPFQHKHGLGLGPNGTVVTYTKIHPDAVETWCPGPTTLYFNDKTYYIDKPTTFKLPDCPCTEIWVSFRPLPPWLVRSLFVCRRGSGRWVKKGKKNWTDLCARNGRPPTPALIITTPPSSSPPASSLPFRPRPVAASPTSLKSLS